MAVVSHEKQIYQPKLKQISISHMAIMLADPLTKALPAPMLESHKLALGLNYLLPNLL